MNALSDSPESILKGVDYCLVTHLHFDHFSVDYLPRDLRIIAQNHEDAEEIRNPGPGRRGMYSSVNRALTEISIIQLNQFDKFKL